MLLTMDEATVVQGSRLYISRAAVYAWSERTKAEYLASEARCEPLGQLDVVEVLRPERLFHSAAFEEPACLPHAAAWTALPWIRVVLGHWTRPDDQGAFFVSGAKFQAYKLC
jgi:hypothetical protein